ncbi:MAG: hypothetical protein NTV80_00980 [Verrucomicrobia bacterium]|nr:hypothetical protein [Verrucomicrobiota bacterium]
MQRTLPFCFFLLVAALSCLSAGRSMAQFAWNGNADATWSGANWTTMPPASSGSGALTFSAGSLTGAAVRSTNNDLTGFTATGITLNHTAGGGIM